MIGGYKIIDLQDVELTVDTGTKIDGVYEAIESNKSYPLLLQGLRIKDNLTVKAFYSCATLLDEKFNCVCPVKTVDGIKHYVVEVDKEDTVTVTLI